ncbi:hypothetical protein [Arthrobacter sp. 31Y]|uniref:hypothetical protein n=1 Tax=Arthrobacter sp. 31Y TaxID=1115632 RepID=UPI00046361C1
MGSFAFSHHSVPHELLGVIISVPIFHTLPLLPRRSARGCNGSTFAALAFAELGYSVKEMIGGIEYWIRNGLPVETAAGTVASTPDALVTAHKS